MKKLDKFSEYYIYFFICFAPWYDWVHFLPPIKLTTPILSQFTSHGLANLTLVTLCLISLVPKLITSFAVKKPMAGEWIILAWPILNILNFKKLDIPGVVSLKNSIFLATCLLCLLRRENIFADFKFLRKFAFTSFFISMTVGLFLPLIFQFDGYPVFLETGDVSRFRGWSGIGSLSFCSITLCAWSLLKYLMNDNSRNEKLMSIAGVIIGIIGVNLTVLRIGWVATVFITFYAFVISLRQNKKNEVYVLACLWFIAVASFYVSKLSQKADFKNFDVLQLVFNVDLEKLREKARPSVESISDSYEKKPEIPLKPPLPPAIKPKPEPEIKIKPAVIPKPVVLSTPKPEVPPISSVKPELPPVPVVPEVPKKVRRQTLVETRTWYLKSREYLWRFDSISNGRIGVLFFLIPALENHWFFGLGTGGAGRELREWNYLTLEAHNEYLRFFIDHGFIGLFLLIMVFGVLAKRFFNHPYMLVFCGAAILMITDNYLIYPCFGYGPMFLGMCLTGWKTTPK
jgi:hypothetical protein